MELWDAYDADGNKLDGITLVRGEPIADGIYHLACDILVRHIDGTYLLMKRAPQKQIGGWEAGAAGSALHGETPLECAMRELREETGVDRGTFTEVGRIRRDAYHVHYVEFFCLTDVPKDAIRLQEGETVAYRWVTKDELNALPPDVLITRRIRQFLPDWEL